MTTTVPPTPPPQRTSLIAFGTLKESDATVVKLQKPLPTGFEPRVVNVRRSRARLRVVKWTAEEITILNEGREPASYMLFAASQTTQRVMNAVETLARAIFPKLKDPTP